MWRDYISKGVNFYSKDYSSSQIRINPFMVWTKKSSHLCPFRYHQIIQNGQSTFSAKLPRLLQRGDPSRLVSQGRGGEKLLKIQNNSKPTLLGLHWNNFGSSGIQWRCGHRRRQQDQHGETFLDDLVKSLGWPCSTSWMTLIICPHFLLCHFWSITSWRRARGSQTESPTNSPQSQIAFSAAGATFPLCLNFFSFSLRMPLKFKTRIMIS